MNALKRCLLAAIFSGCFSATAQADVGHEWLQEARTAIAMSGEPPAARAEAMRRVEEAISGVRRTRGSNGNGNGGKGGTAADDREATAFAVAAFAVLEARVPDQREHLEARLAVTLSRIPETDAKAEGIAMGRAIAREVLGMPR